MKRLACVSALEATSLRQATEQALRAGHRAVPGGAEAIAVRVAPGAEQPAEADGSLTGVALVSTLAELADVHSGFPSPWRV
jgi:hypothetical protein